MTKKFIADRSAADSNHPPAVEPTLLGYALGASVGGQPDFLWALNRFRSRSGLDAPQTNARSTDFNDDDLLHLRDRQPERPLPPTET